MFSSVAVFVFVVLLVYYWTCNGQFRTLAKGIPGPPGYPLIGNALLFLGKPSDVMKRFYQISCEYRRMIALWLGPKFFVILFDARDIEVMLRDRKAMGKADEYRFLRPWLGDSILLSTGSKFRTHRKIMMPPLHVSGLKNHIELFNQHARKLIDSLKCEVGKEEFDIQHYLYHTMLSELLETTLGVSHETLGSENLVKYGIAVAQLCKISHIRSYKLWMRMDSLFRFSKLKRLQDEALAVVHPLTDRVIAQRRDELRNQGGGAEDEYEEVADKRAPRKAVLLDLLLQATKPDGMPLTEQEIKDEMLTVMFAGQDTTTATVGFMLSLLGLHTEVQDKVYAELQSIFGDSDRLATFEDLQQMEYLERVMQETWRLYPPVPMIARKPTADVPLETCVLPKGCTVAIITMILHRNPDFYTNPHQFNPDNFLPERVKARHPYSFIPFSGGLRTCIGGKYATLNIKVLISTLLRSYRVRANRLEKDFKLAAETTLKRKEGFLVGLEIRNAPPDSVHSVADINSNYQCTKSILRSEVFK